MKVLNTHLKNYDSQYSGKDLMSLEEVVLYMNGEYTPFNAKVFGINKELQPHFSEDTVETRIELKQKESIFETPRWITSKKNMELSQGLELISGKDYKVVETIIDADGDKLFKVINSLGVLRSYHEGHFHKVTPEDLKLEVDTEEEDSFDNLVYTPVASDWDYLVLNNLSSEQKDYLMDNIIGMPNLHNTCNASVGFNSESNLWIRGAIDGSRKEIYFNDLFQEVTTHQD